MPPTWSGLVAARQRLCVAMLLHRRLGCFGPVLGWGAKACALGKTISMGDHAADLKSYQNPRNEVLQQPIKGRSDWLRISSGMVDVLSVVERWMPRACGYTVLWRRQDEVVAGTAGPWHHAINAMLDEDEDEEEDIDDDEDSRSEREDEPAACTARSVSRKRPRRSSRGATMASSATGTGTAVRGRPGGGHGSGRRLRKSARGAGSGSGSGALG